MNLDVERTKWDRNLEGVNQYVDDIIRILTRDANADVAPVMIVDMVYRPFLQWLYSAQDNKVDPELARSSAVYFVNTILLQLSMKVSCHAEGKKQSAQEWIDEFLMEVREETVIDLKTIAEGHTRQ